MKLAGALESSHREGVLHRDVKPENVMLSAWGEPHLGDFGIAVGEGCVRDGRRQGHGDPRARRARAARRTVARPVERPLRLGVDALRAARRGARLLGRGRRHDCAALEADRSRLSTRSPTARRAIRSCRRPRARVAEGSERSSRLCGRIRPATAGDTAGVRPGDHQDAGHSRVEPIALVSGPCRPRAAVTACDATAPAAPASAAPRRPACSAEPARPGDGAARVGHWPLRRRRWRERGVCGSAPACPRPAR